MRLKKCSPSFLADIILLNWQLTDTTEHYPEPVSILENTENIPLKVLIAEVTVLWPKVAPGPLTFIQQGFNDSGAHCARSSQG